MADAQLITRTIPGLSDYAFRSDGAVISMKYRTARFLTGGTDKYGYRFFVLWDDSGKPRFARRASLICEAFHGPRPDGMGVRHLDGTRTNDVPSNLAWGTQKENMADRVRHGTGQPRGEKNPRSKLTEARVRELLALDKVPYADLARRWGVAPSTIWQARKQKSWRSATP